MIKRLKTLWALSNPDNATLVGKVYWLHQADIRIRERLDKLEAARCRPVDWYEPIEANPARERLYPIGAANELPPDKGGLEVAETKPP